MGDLMNQHVRFIEPGEEFFREARENLDPKPALGSSENRLIERIQMSTKTTFKRVALVAVAALGFGLLSVVPSTATSQTDTLALGSATSTLSAGSTSVTNTITQTFLGVNSDTMSVTATLTSAPAGNVAMPQFAATQTSTGTTLLSSDNLTGVLTDTGSVTVYSSATATFPLTFAPTKPGTYVITFTGYNVSATVGVPATTVTRTTVAVQAAAVTWTVTVPSGTVADATSTLTLRAASVTTGSATTVSVAAGSSTAAVATIEVTPLTASVASTGSTLITATVSGPGTLSANASGAAGASTGLKSATYSGTVAGAGFVHLFADGTAGTSTVTISIGAVVVGTKTVNFTGAGSVVTSTLLRPAIAAGSAGVAGVISATVKDSLGNGVSGVTLYVVTTGSAIANSSVTSGSAGVVLIPLVGKVAGTSTVTVQSVAAGSTGGYAAAALSVRVGSDEASSVTMAFDKATYSQGEAAVLTVTIKDATGNAVTDGTYAAFAAQVTATRTMGGEALPTASLTTGSSTGVLTFKVNVPSTSGAFSVSALPGAGLLGAGSAVAISASATVSQSAAEIANADAIAAAADAAAEATDAANAATDAANAAAEAADAATAAAQDAADAVATLGTQVAELVAGLKAQIAAQKAAITALTNLVIKIQKKLKA